MKSKIWLAFAALVALNLIDFATTGLLVHVYGSSIELNPIVRFAIVHFGVVGIFLVKAVVLGGVYCVAKLVLGKDRVRRAAKIMLWGICLLDILIIVVIAHSLLLISFL